MHAVTFGQRRGGGGFRGGAVGVSHRGGAVIGPYGGGGAAQRSSATVVGPAGSCMVAKAFIGARGTHDAYPSWFEDLPNE